MALEVGAVVEGVVTGITKFGAFVTLPDGQTGLVHISEVADTYVRDVKDFVRENDKVKVKVLSFDGKGKVALSIKRAVAEVGPPTPYYSRGRASRQSFEDKLARFMKDSDERLSDLKKVTESKRGGRGAGRREP